MVSKDIQRRKEIASQAAKAKNIKEYQKRLDEYLANPNLCQNCQGPILPQSSVKLCVVKKKKFCSQSCSAQYNNQRRERRKKRKSTYRTSCKGCSKSFLTDTKKKFCDSCFDTLFRPRFIENRTRGEVLRTQITRHAIQSIQGEKCCAICGYGYYVEVCHIKAVASFPIDTLVTVINDPSNLVYLCPNHHKEFDTKRLTEKEIRKALELSQV